MPASFEAKPSDPVSEPSAWSAPLFRSPSQRSVGWSIELNIVGEWRDVSAPRAAGEKRPGSGPPRASGEKRRRSAPQSRAGWQLAQAVLPSSDARSSQKSSRPSCAWRDAVAAGAFSAPKSAAASRRSASSAHAPLMPMAIRMAISGSLMRATLHVKSPMARIIGGIGTSHVPTIAMAFDKGKQSDPDWQPLFRGYEPVAKWLAEKKPDVLFFCFNDHATTFFFDHYPTFALGVSEEYRIADEGTGFRNIPPLKGHAPLSRHIARSLVEDEFDISIFQDLHP